MKRLFLACFFSAALSLSAQEFALKQLEASPRHHEWVEVQQGARRVSCFVAFPEVAEKAPVVLVIHENRGLTDWVRSFADQLAAKGYIAVAPDLLSEFKPGFRLTRDYPDSDAARNALYELPAAQVTADLRAVRAYAARIPAGNGQVSVVGFCWGGSQCFRFATDTDSIRAALVFYGSAPADSNALGRIAAPVYGFYAENDQRINATVPQTASWMQSGGKQFEQLTYPGAGHAFMRSGDDPAGSPENKAARDAAWARLLAVLKEVN
jgi:carboxymethylenebutenolidase